MFSTARRVVVLAVLTILPVVPVAAQENEVFRDFGTLRRHHVKAAFDATAEYLAARPGAPDAAEAYRFLFETALADDLAREARPHAERFLKDHGDTSLADKSLARRVAMLALALNGEGDAAIDLFGEQVAAVRRLDPSSAIDSATALAAAVQRGGKPEAAKEVYERLRRGFFLNAAVEAVVENRLARLELLGKPLPAFGLSDLDGKPMSVADLRGKVTLIDFWATNCPPCLEELPELRRLHADHHQAGFEVLAVSLDEEEETVREYLARFAAPWRVFLSTADGDATREAFGVETIPANFLVAADGTVARVDLHGADLRAEVERLLREKQER
jgi:peroxiredoxin